MENSTASKKMQQYVKELLKWNRKVNLIGRNTEPDVWKVHIEDSLSLLPRLKELAPRIVVDIGSGGGLPAIPLAIEMPDVQFILTDVVEKKLSFLEWVISLLGLNARVVNLTQHFILDEECVITSRAFAELPLILQWQQEHTPRASEMLLLEGTSARTREEINRSGITEYTLEIKERGSILYIPLVQEELQ